MFHTASESDSIVLEGSFVEEETRKAVSTIMIVLVAAVDDIFQ